MADEYIQRYDYQKRARRHSNAPLVFMTLMLPVFFLLGFVVNDAMDSNTGTNGLEVGVGGGPDITKTEIVSPMPDDMMEPTPSVTIPTME